MSKRLKDIIRANPSPARGTLGINPLDPWSAKAGLAEDNMLNKFLSSRGINPGFISKDTKISHAKSSAFLKWKQDHQYEEVEINENKWLDRFLSSRGVDPKFVTTDKKVSYAKSGEFAKWLRDHQSEEVEKEEQEIVNEVSGMGMRPMGSHTATQSDHDTVKKHLKNLMAIDSDEPTATSAVHRAIKKVSTAGQTSTKSRSREMLSALVQKHHIPIDKEHRALLNREQVENFDEAKKPTSLQKFRQAAAEREKKHDDIEREMKARHAAGKEDMKGSIDRLEKQLNKEAIDTKGLISKLQKDLPKVNDTKNKDAKPVNWTGPKKDDYGYTGYQGHGMSTDKQERQASKKIKEETGVSKSAETKFHKKLDKLVHSTFGKRKDEMKMKEETEHKVGDSVTVNSKFFGKQKGKVTKIDNQSIHVQRNDKKTSEKYPHDGVVKEDVYQDSQAATQTPSDMGTTPNQTEPTYSRKKEMSKGARIIKALYKNRNMTEAADGQSGGGILFDKEKTDKGETIYGKKPKIALTDKDDSAGENKPDALAVMSGGKTLTGQDRDSVEIDPAMKKRPGQPDSGPKQDGKIR